MGRGTHILHALGVTWTIHHTCLRGRSFAPVSATFDSQSHLPRSLNVAPKGLTNPSLHQPSPFPVIPYTLQSLSPSLNKQEGGTHPQYDIPIPTVAALEQQNAEYKHSHYNFQISMLMFTSFSSVYGKVSVRCWPTCQLNRNRFQACKVRRQRRLFK